MVALKQTPEWSERDYLRLEERSETKHEYTGGLIVAMAGAEPAHNDITMNVAFELRSALGGRPCRVSVSDQRVKVDETGEYFYPDVLLVCGERKTVGPAPHSVTNPSVLVEVSSPSTAAYDRGHKWQAYQQIPSLTDYLVVASDRREVQHYRRTAAGSWSLDTLRSGASVTLVDGITLALDSFYRDVEV